MATFVPVKGADFTAGRMRGAVYDVTFSSSYTTGGEVFTSDDVGMVSVVGMQQIGGNSAAASLLYEYDTANSKILVLYPSGGGAASPAALADPAITSGAVAVTSAAANGAADLTPGRGKEVAAATNLSTITVRCLFLGF